MQSQINNSVIQQQTCRETSFIYSFTTLGDDGRKPSSDHEDVVQKEDTSEGHWGDSEDSYTTIGGQ